MTMDNQQRRTFWNYLLQALISILTGLAAALGIAACSLTFG